MGKTKTKIIDDSLPAEALAKAGQPKESASAKATVDKESKNRPKDILAASLLEQLNKEFGEVKEKVKSEEKIEKEKPSVAKAVEGKKEAKKTKEKSKPRGKKYQEVIALIDKNKKYPLKEAVELAQKTSYTKFNGTMEIHININVKAVRGFITLPFVAGKKLKILSFGLSAAHSDDVIIGDDQTLEEISKGKVNFDVVVTTPQWMPKLAKLAKVLGPKGLMPNPKNGTITENISKTVAELQAGKTEYKTESSGQVIHVAIGKANQPIEEIAANVKSLYSTIGKTKISKITISPTMGPGIKVDLASI